MTSAVLSETGNPRIVMGGNMPPDELSPFELSKREIDALYETEGKNWLDGKPVETQEQHDEVERLMGMFAAAAKKADERRIAENKPFDEGKAAVQAKYADLIADTKSKTGKAVRAISACKAILEPFRIRKQQAAAAEARRIRDEAEAAERAAQMAFQQTNVGDLEQREEAERLAAQSAALHKLAAKADKSATTGTGLVTYWQTIVTDKRAIAAHYWKTRPADVDAFFLGLAEADVRAGARSIPGCEITEQKKARL